jgi:hypothetical protein
MGKRYYWCSIVNAFDRNTAEWLYEKLRVVIEDLLKKGVIITAIVADNEEVNKKLIRMLQVDFGILINIPCSVHLLQLCVRMTLKLPEIHSTIVQMNDIIKHFERSKEARLALKDAQNLRIRNSMTKNKSIYSLVKPCETRWSSSWAAAKRLLFLRDSIVIVKAIEERFWEKLSVLVQFLHRFTDATNVLQSDNATLFDVYSQFASLLSYVNMLPEAHLFYQSKKSISNIIAKYWIKYVDENAIISSAVCSFDDTHVKVFNESKRMEANE